MQDGSITEAVDNQPWSGEANVNVSIVNWARTQNPELLPIARRLWFKVVNQTEERKSKRPNGKTSAKDFELSFRTCAD